DEPRVLKGRRGGTDEFLGRGATAPQSPWPSGPGGRPLDKCLVQPHADAVIRKSHAAVSEAVNSSPVMTPREEENSSAVRGAPSMKAFLSSPVAIFSAVGLAVEHGADTERRDSGPPPPPLRPPFAAALLRSAPPAFFPL